MTTPQPAARPFPELEQLEQTAVAYAWSMLYLGIGAGFVLAWLMCSMRSCQPPREPVAAPCPVVPAPYGAGSMSGRSAATVPAAVPSGRLRLRSSDAG